MSDTDGTNPCCGGYAEHFTWCPKRTRPVGCRCADCADGRLYEWIGDTPDDERLDAPADMQPSYGPIGLVA